MLRINPALFLLSLPFSLQAQESYSIVVDRSFSMVSGAENLLTIDRGAWTLENKFIPPSWFDEQPVVGKVAGVAFRFAKTVALDQVIDQYTCLLQHEVFGHGAKAREYGMNDITYTLNLSYPYGSGQGTTFGVSPDDNPISQDQYILYNTGGVEANAILSKHIVLNWLQRGAINFRETFLYERASNDLTQYLWETKWGKSGVEGNDMLEYERAVNAREGLFDPAEYKLTVNDLAKQAFVICLDPFQYFSLYTFFKTYLYSGEESFEFPMIDMGSTKYLPSFHLGLTPFGSEIYLDNYVVRSSKVIDLYFRYGIPSFHRSWGLGINGLNVINSDPFSFDVRFDIWNQPVVTIYDYNTYLSRGGLGGALSCAAYANLVQTFATIRLIVEVETKTVGYLPGEPLGDAVVLRLGLNLVLEAH